ncbi:hypothetical protein, partial [Rhodococcus sp. EPR-134]|uniref:hypothetical protein n=1 Tax=Rhodococcus sp. EPR-134 TaxID=1813675 RepID=UPI001E55AAF0
MDGDSAQPSCALLVWWDLDAWVLKAEVDERFAAFEVRQDGRRCVVDVEDIDDPAKPALLRPPSAVTLPQLLFRSHIRTPPTRRSTITSYPKHDERPPAGLGVRFDRRHTGRLRTGVWARLMSVSED